MFFASQPAPQEKRSVAPSIISSDLTVRGALSSAGDIQVDGRVEGDIRSASLVVSEKAEIRGELVATSVMVRGRVHGSIRGRQVVLSRTSHVEGDIWYETLDVEAGAFVEGRYRHNADPLKLALPETPADEPMIERRRPGSPMREITAPAIAEIRKTA
jgi:cytoskeletal protein CcmA (bactofilin family)